MRPTRSETVRVDPVSFTAALSVLFAVTATACAVPAWRASRTDPAITLREE